MSKFVKLDAAETIFFENELESVKAKTYDKKYPELKMRKLIPVSFDVDPGADTITYFQYDAVGMAKIVESYAKDFPRVNVRKKKFTSPIESLGDSYGYSIQDIRKARMSGQPLEQREANAAKKGIMQKEDSIAAFGDAKTGLQGLFNHPNVTEVTLDYGDWDNVARTPDEILADLNNLVNTPEDVTNGVEKPDTLILPVLKLVKLNTTPRSATSDTTIMEFFKKANPHITNVESYHKLKGAGAGSTDRMFTYKRDPDYVTLEIPQDFEQFPPQEDGMEFTVYCHERCGGVILYYPLACAFADGI